jgi:putative copper resistance protein D
MTTDDSTKAHSARRMGLFFGLQLGCMVLMLLGPGLLPSPAGAQHADHQASAHAASGWEGSPEGKAYSEFNHHLTGIFVILIGLTELRAAIGMTRLAWTRLLLPLAMLSAGVFLLIWSDHEAWPIGTLSVAQTFDGSDWEMLQHKFFGFFSLGIGAIEWLRRTGRLHHPAWRAPLPVFALLGGLTLFLHSHGVHPAAHKIGVHHAIMGTMAVTAGASKLVSGWKTRQARMSMSLPFSPWELAWSALVLLIGLQLLLYSE